MPPPSPLCRKRSKPRQNELPLLRLKAHVPLLRHPGHPPTSTLIQCSALPCKTVTSRCPPPLAAGHRLRELPTCGHATTTARFGPCGIRIRCSAADLAAAAPHFALRNLPPAAAVWNSIPRPPPTWATFYPRTSADTLGRDAPALPRAGLAPRPPPGRTWDNGTPDTPDLPHHRGLRYTANPPGDLPWPAQPPAAIFSRLPRLGTPPRHRVLATPLRP